MSVITGRHAVCALVHDVMAYLTVLTVLMKRIVNHTQELAKTGSFHVGTTPLV